MARVLIVNRERFDSSQNEVLCNLETESLESTDEDIGIGKIPLTIPANHVAK